MFGSHARAALRARPRSCSAITLMGGLALCACDPKLVVGAWNCPAPSRTADADGGQLTPVTDPIPIPWSTSFETGLCDLDRARGFCYGAPDASFGVVGSPTHTGTKALAFTVTPSDMNGQQARCVREGALPQDAIYGAWFYVPAPATNTGNWNLMHFQGSTPPASPKGWWDVSFAPNAGGDLILQVVDYVGQSPVNPPVHKSLSKMPAAHWVHIEFRWNRATDTSGEVDLYQDGEEVVSMPGVATDDADWGQWYFGNLATALDQPDSTIYVDDISIRAAPH
jgi:hypothetical protein